VSDTDRLAALLREAVAEAEVWGVVDLDILTARLRAAGVTLAAPAEGLDVARVRLIGKIALILDGDGGWERQSRAAIVRSIDEVFEPIIRDAERADR